MKYQPYARSQQNTVFYNRKPVIFVTSISYVIFTDNIDSLEGPGSQSSAVIDLI